MYEGKHPETKKGRAPGAGKGKGKKRLDKSQDETFVKDTAAKTGKGRSSVARDAKRGEQLSLLPDIVGTSLDQGAEIDAFVKLRETKNCGDRKPPPKAKIKVSRWDYARAKKKRSQESQNETFVKDTAPRPVKGATGRAGK
jgi:hypothetical protein